MTDLTGTEKQIAWATEIRAKFIVNAEALIAEEVYLQNKRMAKVAVTAGDKLEKLNNRIEKHAAVITMYQTRTAEILNNVSSATWWIEYGQSDADAIIRKFDAVERGIALGGVKNYR